MLESEMAPTAIEKLVSTGNGRYLLTEDSMSAEIVSYYHCNQYKFSFTDGL